MAGTKWTPEPWHVTGADAYTHQIRDQHQNYLGACSGTGQNNMNRANALLMAAAPELYKALKEISDALEGARTANPEASAEFFEELVDPGFRNRMRDALAKARGENTSGTSGT
jgi:hypothetical protein